MTCNFCKYQLVILTVPSSGRQFLIRLLKSTDLSQKCSCINFVKRSKNFILNRTFLPKIKFNCMDFVLRSRFYEICSPIKKRELRLVSKNLFHFEKKPQIFLVKHILGMSKCIINPGDFDLSTIPRITPGNFIIKFFLNVELDCLQLEDVQSFIPFVEFEYSELLLQLCSFNENDMEIILNKNLTDLNIMVSSGTNFSEIIYSIPNIERLQIDSIIPDNDDWESNLKLVAILGSNLESLTIDPDSINDESSLHEFFNFRPRKIVILQREPNYDKEKFLKFFRPVHLVKSLTEFISDNPTQSLLIFKNTGKVFEPLKSRMETMIKIFLYLSGFSFGLFGFITNNVDVCYILAIIFHFLTYHSN